MTTTTVDQVSKKDSIFDQDGIFTEKVDLLELESKFVLSQEKSVNTITFMKGESVSQAHQLLRERVRNILRVNPWVAGRVVKVPGKKKLEFHYPPSEIAIANEQLLDELVRVADNDENMDITSSMPYKELVDALGKSKSCSVQPLGPAFLTELPSLFDKTPVKKSELQARFTIIPDSTDPEAFGLYVSIGHTSADGASYYTVLNMLSDDDDDILAMNVERKHDASPKMIWAQGQNEYEFMTSTLIKKSVYATVFDKNKTDTKLICRFVDDERMKSSKEVAIATKAGDSEEEPVSFVSSNDVLVSTMANTVGARIFSMAMNFRGRVEGITHKDMGNYETAMLMDSDVYGDPTNIRRVLQKGPPFILHQKKLPGAVELIRGEFGTVSNWSGFAKDLTLGRARQMLHVPCIPSEEIPFEAACVFKPRNNQLAVLLFAKRVAPEAYVTNMPLGDPVSTEIFGCH